MRFIPHSGFDTIASVSLRAGRPIAMTGRSLSKQNLAAA